MSHFTIDGYEWHREVAEEINAAPESERLTIATKRCYDRAKGDERDGFGVRIVDCTAP